MSAQDSLGDAVVLAQRFHEVYEDLAPMHGYETRPDTRKSWEKLPVENRRLMISTCLLILAEMREQGVIAE